MKNWPNTSDANKKRFTEKFKERRKALRGIRKANEFSRKQELEKNRPA